MKQISIYSLLFVIFLWLGGGVWFIITLPLHPHYPLQKSDGIVVLTGGPDRVEAALYLMEMALAQKLLISGVNCHTTLKDILKATFGSQEHLHDFVIDLDYRSKSTIDNARQTLQWVQENHFESIRLVTSHYHLKRALLEFHQRLSLTHIIAHPIIPRTFKNDQWIYDFHALSLLWREYHKYLGALMRYGLRSLIIIFQSFIQ